MKQVLLVMDVQPGIVDRLENKDEFVGNVLSTVTIARQRHIPVVFVVVGFRPGFPEIGASNKSFSAMKENAPAAFIEPRPVIDPLNGEVVVTKKRISAFTGSDLEVVLRGLDTRHLVLCGIATSGVILSTTREAADKDYRLTILSDLCADTDPEVHRVLLEKVFPRQAEVVTSEVWGEKLSNPT